VILVDGRPGEAVNALDRGLAYGDGVFRTVRADRGRVRLWSRHYAKLQRDCERLAIECPSERDLCADVQRLLARSADGVVKIIVTRGAGARGYGGLEAGRATRVVARFPLPAPRGGIEQRGVRARWCTLRLSHQPALAGVKHLNRLENVLARREWTQDDIDEGLLCDVQDGVIGGTMTNVFVLERGRLVTPPLDRCGVEGVQREQLLAAAPALGIDCSIEPLSRARLLAADQVYLLNSVIGLWWLAALDERRWTRSSVAEYVRAALSSGA
jgi:4-amino-4-deoxychorismate lyase